MPPTMRSMHPRSARLALVAYLGFVGLVTMFPTGLEPQEVNLVPLAGIIGAFTNGGTAFGIVQLIGNLLLLAPLGLLLPLAAPGISWSRILLAAAVLSCGIEVVQGVLGTGRMTDVDDVWLNALGAATVARLIRP